MKTLNLCTEALVALRFGRQNDAILALNKAIQLLAEEQCNTKKKSEPKIILIQQDTPTLMERMLQTLRTMRYR